MFLNTCLNDECVVNPLFLKVKKISATHQTQSRSGLRKLNEKSLSARNEKSSSLSLYKFLAPESDLKLHLSVIAHHRWLGTVKSIKSK